LVEVFAINRSHTATTGASIRKLRIALVRFPPQNIRLAEPRSRARLVTFPPITNVGEADESDRSFLMLAPVVAVVTTIDREHLDQYTSLEDIQGAFIQFVNRVPFYGAAILCIDEPNVQAIIPSVKRPIITYGTSSQADLVISDVKLEGLESEFRLTYRGEDLGLSG